MLSYFCGYFVARGPPEYWSYKMRRRAKVISAAQLNAALRRVRKGRHPLRDQVMLLLSHKAGLRAAEITGLTWSMVLASSGTMAEHIAVENRIAKKNGGRLIPMHPSLRSALMRLRRESGCDGRVIKSERGAALRPSSAVNWFRELYRDLGWQGCSSHSGRRGFITNAARKLGKTGGSLRDVMILAGHADLSQTAAYIEGYGRAQRRLVSLI